MVASKDAALEAIMTQIGEWGPYQLRQHLLHLLPAFMAGIHMFALTFSAPTPEHRCFIPELDNATSPAPFPEKYYVNPDDKCLKYVDPKLNMTGPTVSCGGSYHFDKTYYSSSPVIDYGLVCDKAWMRTMLQSIYMVGVLCGAVSLGSMADSFGRKPILYISAVLQLIFGLACAFASGFNYYVWAVLLFFYGAFGSGGAYVTGFVLSMELIGASKRTVCGTAFSFIFAVGYMFVALWAWVIPVEWNGIQLLQIVLSLHSIILLPDWWLVDESIRWLWGKGRTAEALKIANKAIEVNGKYFVRNDQKSQMGEPDPEGQSTNDETTGENTVDTGISIIGVDGKIPENPQAPPPHAGMVDLLRLPNLRFRAMNMAYNWFANSLAYYGLSFNAKNLPGNPFLMNFLTGLSEVPGYIIVILLLDRWGRRSLGSLLLFFGGISCFAIAIAIFFENDTAKIVIAMLAKVAVAGSFGICYNYTAELFPTVIRNSVVGITTMAARGAGMLAPQIDLLGSLGKSLPILVFGSVAIAASFFSLFLPETLNKEIPQTIEDGEHFGKGDNAFNTLWKFFKRRRNQSESRQRLEDE